MSNTKRAWSEGMVESLRAMMSESATTYRDMAERLSTAFGVDVTERMVNGAIERYCRAERIARVKIKREAVESRREEWRRLTRAGCSSHEVARTFGVWDQTIYKAIDPGDRPRFSTPRFLFHPLDQLPLDTTPEPLAIGGKTIVDIENGECRWPIGREPDSDGEPNGPFRFCARPAQPKKCYCDHHTTKAELGQPVAPIRVQAVAPQYAEAA